MERRPNTSSGEQLPDKKRKLDNNTVGDITIVRGGARKSTKPSQKRPTARRLRSSKARKSRKARATRRR